jgi:hypothetical protein
VNLISRWKAAAAAMFAAAAALALAACIVSPGKFESTLDLRKDGTFSFSYNGEIYLLALSKLAEMSGGQDQAFVETPCYDENDFEERPCSEEELAQQRQAWEAQAESRRQQSEREAEQMRQFLGGIDPADPAAAEELAARLRRQEGWKRVEYRGDGLFEVEFSISSRLGHDFAFPTLERFPMANSFVTANLRQGNSVRVEAPGFSAQGTGNPYQSMMAGMAASYPDASGAENSAAGPPIPEMEGTFRVVTDGRVLANNTDEGPIAGAGGQVLEWRVNRRTQSAPMALIQLGG